MSRFADADAAISRLESLVEGLEEGITQARADQAALNAAVAELAARVATLEAAPVPSDPPEETPPAGCGELPEPILVPDNNAGSQIGLIYDFDFEDGRIPWRQQPARSAKLSRKLVAPGSCTSLLMDRLESEVPSHERKTAESARSEFLFFAGSDRARSRMKWGRPYRFQWKFAMGPDWTYPETGYEIVAQIHDSSGNNGGPPFNISAAVGTHSRDGLKDGWWIISGREIGKVQPGPVVPGEWVEVDMLFVPDRRNGKDGGLIEIIWNGEKVVDAHGIQTCRSHNRSTHPTAPSAPIKDGPYFKAGIYKDYKTAGDIEVFFDYMRVIAED